MDYFWFRKWKKVQFKKNISENSFSLLKPNIVYLRLFLSSLFYVFWTQTCRNWTKLFTWTCYFSQVSHALNDVIIHIFIIYPAMHLWPTKKNVSFHSVVCNILIHNQAKIISFVRKITWVGRIHETKKRENNTVKLVK